MSFPSKHTHLQSHCWNKSHEKNSALGPMFQANVAHTNRKSIVKPSVQCVHCVVEYKHVSYNQYLFTINDLSSELRTKQISKSRCLKQANQQVKHKIIISIISVNIIRGHLLWNANQDSAIQAGHHWIGTTVLAPY